MQALGQRAACVARRATAATARPVRNARTYASGHDHHHAGPQVNEGLGTAFYVFAGVVPTSMLFYSISRPGANGEPSSISQWLRGFEAMNKDWETINAMRTDALDRAAHDRHLFTHSNSRAAQGPTVVLKAPELIHSGSPWNVPAGHYANLDHLTEHYRQEHLAEEDRKAKKLAQKAAAAAKAEGEQA